MVLYNNYRFVAANVVLWFLFAKLFRVKNDFFFNILIFYV
jgi:hypothetical protein